MYEVVVQITYQAEEQRTKLLGRESSFRPYLFTCLLHGLPQSRSYAIPRYIGLVWTRSRLSSYWLCYILASWGAQAYLFNEVICTCDEWIAEIARRLVLGDIPRPEERIVCHANNCGEILGFQVTRANKFATSQFFPTWRIDRS